MLKSNKRIRLENEIFSKSIHDIERMFNLENNDEKKYVHKSSSAGANSNSLNRLDLPAGTELCKTSYEYDCVNLSLMDSDTSSEPERTLVAPRPTRLDYVVVPGGLRPPEWYEAPRKAFLDLNDDYDVDGYTFEQDLKSYLPRLNLEKDLSLIDLMFSRPLQISS